MNFKLIEKLEHTTPDCAGCHSATYFVPCHNYTLLKCTNCGQTTTAPTSLTRTILAAYIPHLGKNTSQKRVQPSIL